MVCDKCGNEIMVDHVKDGKVVYVCVNKQCSAYLKAFTSNGEKENTQIKEKTTE